MLTSWIPDAKDSTAGRLVCVLILWTSNTTSNTKDLCVSECYLGSAFTSNEMMVAWQIANVKQNQTDKKDNMYMPSI